MIGGSWLRAAGGGAGGIRRRIAILGWILGGAAALGGEGTPPKRSAALLQRGKATYAIFCVACHGERGAGDGSVAPTLNPKPRNFATERFKQGAAVGQIFETLGKGVPGTAMVKFTNLSDEERWALAWYVLELKQGKPGP
ncbi:MAG TPA: cytochrome c [Myxococcales bacterium]|nr:cytochrome c [Myxococcales bacterium]